jgi:hypothetical protein
MFATILNASVTIVVLNTGRELTKESVNRDPYLIREVIAQMERAHAESQRKSELITEAWTRAREDAKAGKIITTSAPRWLRVVKDGDDKRKFEVIEERAALVRRIFEMAASGMGRQSIMRTLNLEGVKPFSGGKGWGLTTVERILNRKAAMGLHEPGRYDEKHVWQPCGEPFPYYPPIIDEALWLRAQPDQKHRQYGGRRGKHFGNLFIKLARCAHCGGPMYLHVMSKNIFGRKGGKKYLACYNKTRALGCTEGSRQPYQPAEDAILDHVREIAASDLLRDGPDLRGLDVRIADLDRRIETARRTERNLTNLVADSESPTDFYEARKQLRVAEADRKKIVLEREKLAIRKAESEAHAHNGVTAQDRISTLRERLAQASESELYTLRERIHEALKEILIGIQIRSDRTITLLLTNGAIYSCKAGQLIWRKELRTADANTLTEAGYIYGSNHKAFDKDVFP